MVNKEKVQTSTFIPMFLFSDFKKEKWHQISPIFSPAHFIMYSHHPSISVYPILVLTHPALGFMEQQVSWG